MTTTRPAGATPPVVQGEVPLQLRVHVRNNGNIPLRVDAQRVTTQYWVRDDDRRRDEIMHAARRAIRSEQSEPRTPERLRPRQTHDFDVIVTAPRYLVGTRPRRWWVPIGVRAEETEAECEFVDFVQRPQWELEERMVWLGVAVVGALLVLIVFMAALAT